MVNCGLAMILGTLTNIGRVGVTFVTWGSRGRGGQGKLLTNGQGVRGIEVERGSTARDEVAPGDRHGVPSGQIQVGEGAGEHRKNARREDAADDELFAVGQPVDGGERGAEL